MFGLISSGLDLVGRIGSSILNSSSQSSENQKARDFQAQQANLAYQRQVELWNMQNRYNTPAAQMARYAAAGLNPNLIYGQQSQGASPASVPQASSSVSSISPVLNPFSGLFGNYLSIRAMDQDNALKQSEIEANTSRALLYEEQLNNLRSDTARKDYELSYLQKVEKYRVELEALGIPKARADLIAQRTAARKAALEVTGQMYLNEFARRSMQDRLNNVRLGNNYLEQEIKYLRSQTNRTDEQSRGLRFANDLLSDEQKVRRQNFTLWQGANMSNWRKVNRYPGLDPEFLIPSIVRKARSNAEQSLLKALGLTLNTDLIL